MHRGISKFDAGVRENNNGTTWNTSLAPSNGKINTLLVRYDIKKLPSDKLEPSCGEKIFIFILTNTYTHVYFSRARLSTGFFQ